MCAQEVRRAIQERRARTEAVIFLSLAGLLVLALAVLIGMVITTYNAGLPCRGLLCWMQP